MAFQVKIRSKQQILGDILRDILILTDLDDVAEGSSLAVLAESIASSQFQIEASALKILDSTNLGSLTGAELDKKAQAIKLPNTKGGIGRIPASQSLGPIKIGSAFKKISSKLYAGKPAPFSGSFTLNVEDASAFTPTGFIYVGRGTVDRFEGALPYSGIVNNGSFWSITLLSPLTKNHLLSDLVVLAQGADRTVAAGTTVAIPANNQSPSVQFTTIQELVIPDGEDSGTVNVVCSQFGEAGNALANSITSFVIEPFAGATVANTTSFVNGKSTENDEDLRQRIKNYPATLSRGTRGAILAAIQGASDPVSGRTIQSAVVLEPVEAGDQARVYIDDSTGLEPTFGEQPYELLLESASGQEKQFRTAQFPITAAALEGANSAPFVIQAGQTITIQVDEVVETYTISSTGYANYNSATAYEIVRDLNAQSNIVGFRTLDGGKRLVVLDLSGSAEIMKIGASDLQKILGFPLVTVRPIFVYQDSKIQSFRGRTGTLETRPRNQWNINAADLTNIRIKVDGVTQTFSIADADFASFGTNISSASIDQWTMVLSSKIAGVKFTASGQILVWSTWQAFSAGGSIEILETKADGTPAGWVGDDKVWRSVASGGALLDTGFPKDYKFNRFTGELTFTKKPAPGTKIEIGSRNTRAFISSNESATGLFGLAPIPLTVGNSKLVLGFDGEFAVRDIVVPSGTIFTPSIPDSVAASNILRLTLNSIEVFKNAEVGDWVYLLDDASQGNTWGANVEGFYRIRALGLHKFAVATAYSALTATSAIFAGPIGAVKKGRSLVTVTKTAHGLKTGDLVTVVAGAAIGGISDPNLSVTNAPVIVLGANQFTYTALASATSDAQGVLTSVAHNLVTVNQPAHGFTTGALVTTVASAGFGGLSAPDLSVPSAVIEVVDINNWIFRADAAATSAATGSITTATYQPDSWVEVEISTPQAGASGWAPLLGSPQSVSEFMVSAFRSTTIPQLVDFGPSVSSMTVDQIVTVINASISSGTAQKVTPQFFAIRSNDYDNGTCAVLAVIGNSTSLFTTESVASSIQAHTAYSLSSDLQGGFPIIKAIELPTSQAAGYSTRTYLKTDRDLTDILNTATNPAIEAPATYVTDYPMGFQELWVTGRQAGLVGRVYNNQTTQPFSGIMRGVDMVRPMNTSDTEQTSPDTLDRYSNYAMRLQDLPFTKDDKFVTEMDLNPTDRTVSIAIAKVAKIQDIDPITGSGKGQVISFRLKDPEDANKPFFDPTSVYKAFDFADFKLLIPSVGLYREDVSDRALILRSVQVGAQNRFRFSIRFPTLADTPDFVITHSSSFGADGISRLTLIVTLPSDTLIAGSTLGSGTYRIAATATGTIFNWRITSGLLNAAQTYQPGDVLNISGNNAAAESYEILTADYKNYSGMAATTANGFNVVTVTKVGHGFLTGDLVSITAVGAIGGISSTDLSQTDTPVTMINANTFSYLAGASATSNAAGVITTAIGGQVTVKSPGSGGFLSPALFNASQSTISGWALLDKTWQDLADAINDYFPDSPVATAQAIGTLFGANPVAHPTYVAMPAGTAYAGTDMNGAFDHHVYACKYAGLAGIWQYDSSNASLNNIKATVQADEAVFPTTTEAAGTTYSPIDEQVYLAPSNNKTLKAWLEFKAASSLNILASIERTQADSQLQISSREDGSLGAVNVTGVNANALNTGLSGNGSEDGSASKVNILNADAKTLAFDSVVKVFNTLSSEIRRSYRSVPSGAAVTASNPVDVNTYFRTTNSIKYVRINQTTGRVVFLRNGLGAGQTEPLTVGNTITLANLGSGLVQATWAVGAGTNNGKLAARVGDMLYVQPGSNFPVDVRCKAIPSSGITDGDDPEYLGYPVVHIINDESCIIIAPNITTFGVTSIAARSDFVFLPAVWNEKNIRTNHAEGARFDDVVNSNAAHYLVKTLGNGIVSIWLQNSATEANDDMKLHTMSVSSDDWAVLGNGFDAANQGTFKVIAHNGRNQLIVYNPEGGRDELIDLNAVSGGGMGERKWRVGPLNDGFSRPIRIVDAESVRIGDSLRISTPSNTSQWFNSAFFGSWKITAIGVQALDYTAIALPHTGASGVYSQAYASPYIEFEMESAPISVKDTLNADVDKFVIGANASSVGFTEGTPFFGFRKVSGHSVNAQNSEIADLYLTPKINTSKMSETFGTVLTAWNKIGFEEQAFQGIDGYKIFTGPVQVAHRIIDGLPQDTVLFPGVKAAGAIVEVLPPLIRSLQISLQVRPKDGVTLNSINDLVKSSIATYINNLGVGKAVVLSEIIRVVQSLPGVFSVKIISTTPVAEGGERVIVSDIEKAVILDISSDIAVG